MDVYVRRHGSATQLRVAVGQGRAGEQLVQKSIQHRLGLCEAGLCPCLRLLCANMVYQAKQFAYCLFMKAECVRPISVLAMVA